MSNQSNGSPQRTVLQAVDLGTGKILLHSNAGNPLEAVLVNLNQFAMEVARSDVHLSDMDEYIKEVESDFKDLNSQGVDTSLLDINLQARYTKVLEDSIGSLIDMLTMGVTNKVMSDIRKNQRIIY